MRDADRIDAEQGGHIRVYVIEIIVSIISMVYVHPDAEFQVRFSTELADCRRHMEPICFNLAIRNSVLGI